MRRELVAGTIPAALLFIGFLLAAVWPRPIVPADRTCAEGIVTLLRAAGLNVRHVYRWSHHPFQGASCATTMRTEAGWVQAVMILDGHDSEAFRVDETAGALYPCGHSYRHVVTGGPDTPDASAWESTYPWFFAADKHWLLITHDAVLDRLIKERVNRQEPGR